MSSIWDWTVNFRVVFFLYFKTSPGAQPFIWKWFYLHVYCLANQTHFHMNGCAPGLVLKQRQKSTRKWPVASRREKLNSTDYGTFKYRNIFSNYKTKRSKNPIYKRCLRTSYWGQGWVNFLLNKNFRYKRGLAWPFSYLVVNQLPKRKQLTNNLRFLYDHCW